MTKQESQILKGVAILLMIFLHLFNQIGNVELCENLIVINGTPLVFLLRRASNPVAFFLILGGYGLYKVFEKGDKHRWTRLLKLLIHYWVILVVFVTIGHFMYPNRYPGSWKEIISNVTGFYMTYNSEMWFLLPYLVLSALAPWIFRFFLKFRAIPIILSTLFIHLCTFYCISRYRNSFLYHNWWVYNPLLVFHLLFNFSLGAMAARCNYFEKLKEKTSKIKHVIAYSWILMIALIALNCYFKYNFFYAFCIISCLTLVHMQRWINKILYRLGNQSMNMWMIHSWFCYYLFHNFIYSFKYPLLIFIVLVLISYYSSIIINFIVNPIESCFMTKKEIKEKPIL